MQGLGTQMQELCAGTTAVSLQRPLLTIPNIELTVKNGFESECVELITGTAPSANLANDVLLRY